MNIYFAGTEDIDFVNINGIVWGVGGTFRSNYVRMSANAVAASGYFTTPTFGSRNLVWAHAQCSVQDNRTSSGQFMLYLYETSLPAAGGIGVSGTGTSGQVSIVKRSNASVITTLATSAAGAVVGGQQSIDFFVNYSTSGRATLWMGGVLIVDTGPGIDVTTDGATGVSSFYMGATGNNNYYWSEVIVADSDTRNMGLALVTSSTAGTAQQWAGTASNVNQGTINDSNFISAASSGLLQEYKPAALPSGSFNVVAVVMSARVSAATSAPLHFDFLTQIAGTNYFSVDYTPTSSFGNFPSYVQLVNPATGSGWTTSSVAPTSMQYGLRAST